MDYIEAVSRCNRAYEFAASTANLGASSDSVAALTEIGVVCEKPDPDTVVYNHVWVTLTANRMHKRFHIHHSETYFFDTPSGVRRCGITSCRFNRIVRVSDDPEVAHQIKIQKLNEE